MPELLETLDALSAGDVAVRALSRRDDPRYMQSLAEAARLIQEGISGNRHAVYRLQEAMSTSDFPVLFADILDRQLLADYQQGPSQWRQFAREGTVRDFRTVKRFAVDGGLGLLG